VPHTATSKNETGNPNFAIFTLNKSGYSKPLYNRQNARQRTIAAKIEQFRRFFDVT
jgi:hypothetical protein